MRILLDDNVPMDVLAVLRAAGYEADSVNFLGWKGLQNGALLTQARSSYNLFLTKDKDFDEAALGRFVNGDFGIVLLAIPQQKGPEYASVFAALWPDSTAQFLNTVTRLAP